MFRLISQKKMLESNGGSVPVYEYDDRGILCYRGEADPPCSNYVSRVNGKWIVTYNKFYDRYGLKL